jgi:hypothetical protein
VFPNFWPSSSGLKTPGSAWVAGLLAVLLAVLLPCLLLLGGLAIDLLGWEHQRVERTSSAPSSMNMESSLELDSLSEYASIGPVRWQLSRTPVLGSLSAPQMTLGIIAILGLGLILMSVGSGSPRHRAATA